MEKEIFLNYLNNSTKEILDHGTNGCIIKINCNKKLDKAYRKISPNLKHDEQINELIIKLCILSNKSNEIVLELDNDEILTTTETEFINEINIQKDIENKTSEYLEPICPVIYYYDIIDIFQEIIKLFNLFELDDNIILIYFLDFLKNNPDTKLGFIVMEYVENTLYDYYNKTFNDDILNIGRYILIKLALDTEYNHNDFHMNNFLISTCDSTYFNSTKFNIRPYIIDFGRTKKIDSDNLNTIRELVKNKNYTKVLSLLGDFRISDSYVSDPYYEKKYGWICGDYNLNDTNYYNIYIRHRLSLLKKDFNNENFYKMKKQIKIPRKLNDDINVKIDELFNLRINDIKKNI